VSDSEVPPNSSLLLYETEDGGTRVECRFDDDTLWLTQAQMAELFQTSIPNVKIHLRQIHEEGELAPAGTIKPYLIVRPEGRRRVSRPVQQYSLLATVTDALRAYGISYALWSRRIDVRVELTR
jgi:hypothetical protein